jgi:hypothetical protein
MVKSPFPLQGYDDGIGVLFQVLLDPLGFAREIPRRTGIEDKGGFCIVPTDG